jgi:uncharacterized protein YdbL (DUF1318 family)
MRTMTAMFLAMFFYAAANAADAKIDLSFQNPAIQKLQERMSARAGKLETWKSSGAVGEDATGLLVARPATAQTLAEKKEIRDLVTAENEDRFALFRELIAANGLQEKDLASVGAEFAASRRRAAAPGHWVQHPSSKEWVQKKDLRE